MPLGNENIPLATECWDRLGHLSLLLAIHVLDEASHDFLSLYNTNASAIPARISWLPIPTFTFNSWLAGLLVVVLLLEVSPFACRRHGFGVAWIRPLAWIFAATMVLNGLNHVAASVCLHRLAPGVESAPSCFLAACILEILSCARVSANACLRIYICLLEDAHLIAVWT